MTLDGSASFDPDNDELSYTWRGELWEMAGRVVTVPLRIGTHEITLTVKDPSGHIDRDTFKVTVVEDPDSRMLAGTTMVGAHPNPFNAGTRVFFELEKQGWVSLQVYDLQGRLVRTLEEGTFDLGRHETFWNGSNDAGRIVTSDIYFISLRAGEQTKLSKIVLLR